MSHNNTTAAELPENWILTTIGEVVNRERIRVDPQDYPELPYIGMEDVEAETMRLLDTRAASEMKSSAEYFRPGDVLYGRLRPYLNKVYRPDFEGLGSAEFIVFRRVPHLESKYLQYFLNQWSFVAYINRRNTGDRPRVKFSQMAEYPFPVAPRNEQKRIVDEIDKQFTRLEAASAGLRRIQADLERYKASVLKAACEGRLVPQEANLNPDYEPAGRLLERILEERRRRWEEEEWQKHVERAKKKVEQARRKEAGLPYYFRDMEPEDWMDVPEGEYRDYLPKTDKWKQKYEEPEPPDTDELPELPEGWAWANMDMITTDVTSGSRGWAKYYRDSGSLFVRVGNFARDEIYVDLDEKAFVAAPDGAEADRTRLELGDILITITGEVGMAAVADERVFQWNEAYINQHVALLRPALSEIGHIVAFFLNSRPIQRQFQDKQYGLTKPGLNLTDLKSLLVPIPPRGEQRRIIAELERQLSIVETIHVYVAINLKRADRLRQSILQRAFNGQLVPQDPNDEPADILLARIEKSLPQESSQTTSTGRPVKKSVEEEATMPESRSLYEVIVQTGGRLTVEEVFLEYGLDPSEVDEFYQELRDEIARGRIVELRPNESDVFLEVAQDEN